MNTKATTGKRQIKTLFVVITVLFLAIAACSIETNPTKNTPDETDIARSVEQTLIAEETETGQLSPTEDTGIQQTIEAQQATLEAQTTIIAQQATLDAQSTLLAQPSATQENAKSTATSPGTSTGSTKPISLTNWKSNAMIQKPGCGQDPSGPPCWFGKGDELIMTLQKPILIDNSWPSPYLVYSQHYFFAQNATIYVQQKGSWKVLWSFPAGQNPSWQQIAIDLSKFKGEEIVFQFSVSGGYGSLFHAAKKNEWYIRDPQINPNYSPY